MTSVAVATPIIVPLTERQGLEALANSRKSEARMRDRTRIVLLAAPGHGSRAISRELHRTPGTV
jgi:hypothetical protein